MYITIISLLFAFIGIGNSFIIADHAGIAYWHIFTQFFGCLITSGFCCLALMLCYRFVFKFRFNPNCTIFKIPKVEQKIYDKIRVKKWKHVSPDLGFFVGFKKGLKNQKNYDIKSSDFYKKFLYENINASYMHATTILTCPLFYFIINPHFYITIGLFTFLIIFTTNIVPVILQRYNRPRLLKLYNYSIQRSTQT